MSETEKEPDGGGGGGTATAPPPAKPKKKEKTAPVATPKKGPPGLLPQWKVLLHNDPKNEFNFVVFTVMELTKLNQQEALLRTLEAHKMGVSLLLVTHKERAELYKDQFASKGLTVTIEPEK